MSEMQSEEEFVFDETKVEEETIAPHSENILQAPSREPLWGAILFTGMLLFVIVSIVSIVWIVYSQWKNERAASAKPSIAVLSLQSGETGQSVGEKTAENNPEQQAVATVANNDASAKKMVITVLNGGAVKGSANTITTFLKTEGYTNVTAGNTVKNYSGTVVYYAQGFEKEAGSIKESLVKKYPQTTISSVDEKNKETSASQITIILGK